VIRSARRTKAPAFAWVNALLERRPARLVSVALANKAARIAWAILICSETYRAPAPTASRSLATAPFGSALARGLLN
jgi:transposase